MYVVKRSHRRVLASVAGALLVAAGCVPAEVTIPGLYGADPIDPFVGFDCETIPRGPFTSTELNATASEDLAFDQEGHLVGSDMEHIWKSTHGGTREMFVPNFPFRAGIRSLPNGAFVVADNNTGALVRVNADATRETVISGLAYPNGLEVDRQGLVYLTEHDAKRVHRIDPYSGEITTLTDGVIENPNGITFNEDFTALYIGGFSGEGTIYRLPLDELGQPGALEEWATNVGTGALDGMAVDYCGNVYVADYGRSIIYRLSPDGIQRETILDGAQFSGEEGSAYLPNMQWGSGIGDWDPLKLYVPEGWVSQRTFEVDIGVPSKIR